MDIRPEYKKKPIRSYVIRSGRMTEGQRAGFDNYWPDYGLRLKDGAVQWPQVFQQSAPVVLEIGFGMGDSLIDMAAAETDKNFVGIEVHSPGVGRLISRAGEQQLSNLKVYMADALDVLDDCIADNSLSRIQIYFPDPWHKTKHHKRRLIQAGFVQKLRTKLIDGGVLHLATDWQNYGEHMLNVLSNAEGFVNQAVDGYAPRPDYRPITKFERRGERLGHGVWDLLFEKRE